MEIGAHMKLILKDLFKNRITNCSTTIVNLILIVVSMTMLFVSLNNLLNVQSSFATNDELYIILEQPTNIEGFESKIKDLSCYKNITYIEYTVNHDYGLVYRKYYNDHFSEYLILKDNQYQVVAPKELRKDYPFGSTITIDDIEYSIIDFSDVKQLYCSGYNANLYQISYVNMGFKNADLVAAKAYLDSVITAKSITINEKQLELGQNVHQSSISYYCLIILSSVILLFFPYFENLKKENRVLKIVGYTKMQIVIITLVYQLAFSLFALLFATIFSIIFLKTFALYYPIVIISALSITIINCITAMLTYYIK